MTPRSLLVSILVVAAPATASAGGYASLGVGPAPSLNDGLGDRFSGDGHTAARVAIGQRLKWLSIEGGLGGHGLHGVGTDTADVNGEAITAMVSGKGNVPLFIGVSGYLRAGVGHTWVSSTNMDLDGSAYHGGLGLEFGLDLLVASASVWLEGRRDVLDLDHMGTSYDGSADSLMLGVSLGM